MMEPARPAASSISRTSKALQALDNSLVLARHILSLLKPDQPQDEALLARQLATYGIAVYATWTVEAIRALVSADLSQQALLQARALWELRVNLLFIEKDWQARAPRFIYHDVVTRRRFIEEAGKNPAGPWGAAFREHPEKVQEIEQAYQDLARHFPELVEETRGWSGKSIKDMADAVDLGEEYRFLYRWLSERTHGSVRALGECFQEGDMAASLIASRPDYGLEVSLTAAAGLLQVLGILNDVFDLGQNRTIEAQIQELALAPPTKDDSPAVPD